jgi:hypothetical protein
LGSKKRYPGKISLLKDLAKGDMWTLANAGYAIIRFIPLVL